MDNRRWMGPQATRYLEDDKSSFSTRSHVLYLPLYRDQVIPVKGVGIKAQWESDDYLLQHEA